GFYRIGGEDHNRDILRCLLRRQGTGDIQRYDHVDLEPDKLGRKPRKLIELSFCRAKLECNVLPLRIAQFAQSFPDFPLERIRGRDSDVARTYSRDPGRLWRLGREGRSEDAATQDGNKRPPVDHWMISSARTRMDCGIVNPRAVAVLRLMTNSNLVGCSMGSSAGLAPLRILSL